jgi:hypothetical protein
VALAAIVRRSVFNEWVPNACKLTVGLGSITSTTIAYPEAYRAEQSSQEFNSDNSRGQKRRLMLQVVFKKPSREGVFLLQRLIDLARSFIMPVRQLQIDKFRLGLSKWCPRLYASHVGVCEDS